MECKESLDKLIFYIDGELNKDEQFELNKHLKVCSSCTIAYEKLINKLAVIDMEKELLPNPFLSTKILQKIENSTYKNVNQKKRILQPVFLTVIIIIALFTGILLGNSYQTIVSEENISEQIDDLYFNELYQENIELTLLTSENE